jgi:hypothetical protein
MWNRNLESVLHYSSEEIARSHPLEFFEGTDRILIEENIRKGFEAGETSVEAVLVARNGTKTPYFFTVRRIDRNGEPVLVVLVWTSPSASWPKKKFTAWRITTR